MSRLDGPRFPSRRMKVCWSRPRRWLRTKDLAQPPNSDVEADVALTAFGTTQLNAVSLGERKRKIRAKLGLDSRRSRDQVFALAAACPGRVGRLVTGWGCSKITEAGSSARGVEVVAGGCREPRAW